MVLSPVDLSKPDLTHENGPIIAEGVTRPETPVFNGSVLTEEVTVIKPVLEKHQDLCR